MMVQGYSAQLFLPLEHRLPVNKNHTDIVKFDPHVDLTYQSVVHHMNACIGELSNFCTAPHVGNQLSSPLAFVIV